MLYFLGYIYAVINKEILETSEDVNRTIVVIVYLS